MATLIPGKRIDVNKSWEPGLDHYWGICSSTVDKIDPPFTMQHVIIPPGHKGRAHYHINAARGTYILKGRMRFFFGPKHEEQVFDVEEGDFIYTARGEIHNAVNLSDNESAEIISVYVGAADKEASGKMMVEG